MKELKNWFKEKIYLQLQQQMLLKPKCMGNYNYITRYIVTQAIFLTLYIYHWYIQVPVIQ